MKIAVLGAGALGCSIGGTLARVGWDVERVRVRLEEATGLLRKWRRLLAGGTLCDETDAFLSGAPAQEAGVCGRGRERDVINRVSKRNPIWRCKIGLTGGPIDMPDGCDLPMRMAVREAFLRITGRHADFVFSGWNAELTESELAVVEDREPRAEGSKGDGN